MTLTKKIKDQDTQSEMHGGQGGWGAAKGQGCVSPHRFPAEGDTRLHPTPRPRIQSDKEHQYAGWRLWLGRQGGGANEHPWEVEAGSGFGEVPSLPHH